MGGRILALCGGVGGAKLALGFEYLLKAGRLNETLIAVNTGDDFIHLGLQICPDIDTVTYTLAGLVNPATGWGRAADSDHCLQALRELGGEDWFYLGDKDLAIHLERSHLLQAGWSLSQVTQHFARRFGIASKLIPMCDQAAPTTVQSSNGHLSFQHYFVRERCVPMLYSVNYGGKAIKAHPVLLEAIEKSSEAGLSAIVICPSNPYLSIDPILALDGLRDALKHASVPVIAISPVVGGKAIKGPTAKIMAELGVEVSSASIAEHYSDFLDCLVVDESDSLERGKVLNYVPYVELAPTVMNSDEDKITLAKQVVAMVEQISKQTRT